ncbi:MAG TPA: NAD(P)H-hydrate epimerase, partial [Roseimicrobium sp.]|nr:NAD(P)H-hydrate epimerase [Roseimicrobium sp.]
MASPILSVSQMREWESATWATGVSEHSVIHNVGRRLAERVMERTKAGDRLLLLAGRGNNGADVRAMVAHLSQRTIELIDVIDPVAALAEVSEALSRHPEWVVDGLFGIGLSRPLDESWIRLVNRINESRLPVLSVDVPSGLNADTGVPDGAAVMAAWTVCVGAIKQGLLAGHAIPYVGKLDLLSDIGLSAPPGGQVQWTDGADFSNFPPRRSV